MHLLLVTTMVGLVKTVHSQFQTELMLMYPDLMMQVVSIQVMLLIPVVLVMLTLMPMVIH